MLKEQGYDEYLAEQVRKGLADSEAGRVISLDEANAKWEKLLQELDKEMKQFKQDVVNA